MRWEEQSGTLGFPSNKPIPYALVTEAAKFQLKERINKPRAAVR